jgi:hypothetical protein
MAKIGVFGKVSEFGGKYYKGRLVKKFEESPLHYLLGRFSCPLGVFLTILYNYFMVSVFGWPDPNTRECCES